ncbi:MAG: protein kinase domain-containing protein [Bryobacteraceae bacterium]
MQAIGRYQILSELGRGAMGVVYRALDPAINRPVAIKTIKLEEFSDPVERERLRERLFREAQSAGILSHPNIVTVYDVGEEGDVTYIAMEFVNGSSLEKLLKAPQPPEAQMVLSILQQTAAALDFAHKKGIVHRDIKPANIMLDEDGTAKIADFGVAKIAQSQQMTQTGMVLGTPNYMSPEQVQGKSVDGRADQFSLGVAAYEMLTGEKPFAAETLTTVLYKIVSEEPLPPQHLNPTLAWAVAMVLSRALSKDPAKRYPTCTEFIAALEAALKTKKGWKPLARGSSQNLPTEVLGAPIGVTTTQRNARVKASRRRGLLWPILALLMAMLGVAGVFVWFGHWRPWERQPDRQPPEQVAAPAEPAASIPRPSPTLPMPAPVPPEEKPPQPAETKPVEATAPPQPKPPALQPLQVVTDPPGAKVVLDEDSTKTCQSPCSFQLDSQRHTLAFDLAGYRAELRILPPSRQPQELFVPLTRMVGTVMVMADALGAQILIDGKPIPETTPAKLTLPAGKYNLSVLKDGHRADQEIEVKDGSLLKFTLQLNP